MLNRAKLCMQLYIFSFLIIKYTKYVQNLFHNVLNKITKMLSAYFGNFWFLEHILQI